MLERMEDKQRAIFSQDWIFHEITLRNVGGIPMPVPLQLTYADGTTELLPLPVEIWANNEPVVTKVIASPAPIQQIASIPHVTWRMRIGITMCSPEKSIPAW